MTKEELKKIVKFLKLDTNEKVLENLESDFEKLEEEMIKLKSIDVEGIEPMYMIDESPITLMREDVPQNGFTKEQVLHNSKNHDSTYVTIEKVVK